MSENPPEMRNDIVNRVARAIVKAKGHVWNRLRETQRHAFRIQAIAAIAAMTYEDGWDEQAAIAAGNREGLDAALLTGAFDAMIEAHVALGRQAHFPQRRAQ